MISVKQQYLKPFNCVPKLNYWYYLAILVTINCVQIIEACWNRIVLKRKTCNHFTARQKD